MVRYKVWVRYGVYIYLGISMSSHLYLYLCVSVSISISISISIGILSYLVLPYWVVVWYGVYPILSY